MFIIKETIIITNINSRAQIIEEAIHHQQRLKYGSEFVQNAVNKAKLEIEAQDGLLRIGKKEGWSASELAEIQKAKGTWQKKFETLQKENNKK